MEDGLQETQLPEIWETDEEKKLSVMALKKKYIAFARSNFISSPPKSILNKHKRLAHRDIKQGH